MTQQNGTPDVELRAEIFRYSMEQASPAIRPHIEHLCRKWLEYTAIYNNNGNDGNDGSEGNDGNDTIVTGTPGGGNDKKTANTASERRKQRNVTHVTDNTMDADEANAEVQRRIDQGMREDFAVEEVMKRMRGES
jgi:hypothetical protein